MPALCPDCEELECICKKKKKAKKAKKKPVTPKADDYYEDDEQLIVSDGMTTIIENRSQIMDILLNMIVDATKLNILLSESDHDEATEAAARLSYMKELVSEIPTKIPAKKVVGFDPKNAVKIGKLPKWGLPRQKS